MDNLTKRQTGRETEERENQTKSKSHSKKETLKERSASLNEKVKRVAGVRNQHTFYAPD